MKNTLNAIYIRFDITTISLAKTALAQLILKIIYLFDVPIDFGNIENALTIYLTTRITKSRIQDAINILYSEGKIEIVNNKFTVGVNQRTRITEALKENDNRTNRIIDHYFPNTQSSRSAVKDWIENVTIEFFTLYRNEWIAEKTFQAKKQSNYRDLETIIDDITQNDQNIDKADADWLKRQYIIFFHSSDIDVESIMWDYGTCAFSSTLITSSTAADKFSIEALRGATFIIDTNILMDLQLEEEKFYTSYKSLEVIFERLNIKTFYFNITKDEYLKSMMYKTGLILKVLENFKEDVLLKADDPYLRTAKRRHCGTLDDYKRFFDSLLTIPDTFVDSLPLNMLEEKEIDAVISKGKNDTALQNKLNTIYKSKPYYSGSSNWNKGYEKSSIPTKNKFKGSLIHDSGLIKGAEYLREKQKCFILTRDFMVKQYGVASSLRDDPPISIGLDTLINMLAINNGGIDIDPTNFKPLFANIIKSSLFPERNAFQIVDLVKIFDIEQQVAELPDEDVIEIADDFNKNRLRGIPEEKLSLQLMRKFTSTKLKLTNDLDTAHQEIHLERIENQKLAEKEARTRELLRKSIHEDLIKNHRKKISNNRIIWFVVLPILLLLSILVGLYLIDHNIIDPFSTYVIGYFTSLIVGIILSIVLVKPKLWLKYEDEQSLEELAIKKLNEQLENAK